MENKKKNINGMLTGLLVLQLIMAVLSIFTAINFLSTEKMGYAILNFITGGFLLISGITLRLYWGIGYYLTYLLGLVIVLGNIMSLLMGGGYDILSIVLGLILVSVFFNKRIKEEVI